MRIGLVSDGLAALTFEDLLRSAACCLADALREAVRHGTG